MEGADRSKANANYSAIREMKKEEVHAMNSVILRELYFDGMSAAGGDPGEAAQDVLKKRFGSIDKWVDDFKAAAVSARGWAILALHPVKGRPPDRGSARAAGYPVAQRPVRRGVGRRRLLPLL
jgi:superoxide dismutase, Fe-Mn family